jgi:hypothetical protein
LNRATRNHANRPLLNGKRFDATEDRDPDRTAFAAQPLTEVMHPKSICREHALENDYRSGID